MPTYKTEVIERIFNSRYDPVDRRLETPIVTLQEISEEIASYNRRNGTSISTRNPANFFKDIVRNLKNANEVWPRSVFRKGWTGARISTRGSCFDFVPVLANAKKPFEEIVPSQSTKSVLVSTLSIPPLARAFSRNDEAWLSQVAARLQLVEMHLAASSPEPVTYVELLQTSLKQNIAEIDALYVANLGEKQNAIITVEAKTRDDIYSGQILAQVIAIQHMKSKGTAGIDLGKAGISHIIPLAMKAIGGSKIYVAEFEAVPIKSKPKTIKRVAETIIILTPPLGYF